MQRFRPFPTQKYSGSGEYIGSKSIKCYTRKSLMAETLLTRRQLHESSEQPYAISNYYILIAGTAIVLASVVAVLCFLLCRRRRQRRNSMGLVTVSDLRKVSRTRVEVGVGKRIAKASHRRMATQDMDVCVGDLLTVVERYNDGWANGVNETSGQTGSFPYACVEEKEASIP